MPNVCWNFRLGSFLDLEEGKFCVCAAAPDTIFDKITAVDRAIEQSFLLFHMQSLIFGLVN